MLDENSSLIVEIIELNTQIKHGKGTAQMGEFTEKLDKKRKILNKNLMTLAKWADESSETSPRQPQAYGQSQMSQKQQQQQQQQRQLQQQRHQQQQQQQQQYARAGMMQMPMGNQASIKHRPKLKHKLGPKHRRKLKPRRDCKRRRRLKPRLKLKHTPRCNIRHG